MISVLFSETHREHWPIEVMRVGVFRPARDIPERADAMLAALRAAGHLVIAPAEHGLKPVASVHTPEYIAFLEEAYERWHEIPNCSDHVLPDIFPVRRMVGSYPNRVVGRAGYHMHDQLAPIGPGTYRAALGSANLAADAAQRVLGGAGSIYALCRPPGHHAYRDMGGGACFFNNAAVAAEYLRRSLDRVAILDVDVHHGNGTQGIFYQRADVYYVSIHRDPSEYHPYFIGYADERGEGDGLGYNLNVPLPAFSEDAPYLEALDYACRRIEKFVPDALIVSLGLDAHKDDPSEGLRLSTECFARIAERIAVLQVPTILLQEGGYNPRDVGGSLVSFLSGLAGAHRLS